MISPEDTRALGLYEGIKASCRLIDADKKSARRLS